MTEDVRAFPYKPPEEDSRERYKEIFALKEPLRGRTCKLIFDKFFSLTAVIIASPIFIAIFTAYFLDGIIHPEHRGSIFAPYIASTAGRKFNKYKFRLAKESLVDQEARKKGDYRAYPSQFEPANLTCVGKFLKKYYLDELPQIFNILKGDISFVGPRALAWEHYQRDLSQGNVARKLQKAGLFSYSHTRKGTPDFGRPELDYKYIEEYMKLSAPSLLWADIKIMARGIKMILEGKGY